MSNKYKELIKAQIKLEMEHSKYNTVNYIKMFIKPVAENIAKAAEDLISKLENYPEDDYYYTVKSGETRYRNDLKTVHEYILAMGTTGVIECYYQMYATVIPAKIAPTLQAVVGSILPFFKGIETMRNKLIAVEIVMLSCEYLELDVYKGAERAYVTSVIELEDHELAIIDRQGTTLPSIIRPRRVRNNRDIGYRTFKKSLIMGGKAHDKHCNLHHINRRNSIGFRIEPRVRDLVTPVFDETRKVKKSTGKYETDIEIEERRTAWKQKQAELPYKIAPLMNKTIYFAHRYDNRYRTYAEQYHLNYQGDTDDKALIELAKREVILDDW